MMYFTARVYKLSCRNRQKTATEPQPVPVATEPSVAVVRIEPWSRLQFRLFLDLAQPEKDQSQLVSTDFRLNFTVV
jgi:hypothetical protein